MGSGFKSGIDGSQSLEGMHGRVSKEEIILSKPVRGDDPYFLPCYFPLCRVTRPDSATPFL